MRLYFNEVQRRGGARPTGRYIDSMDSTWFKVPLEITKSDSGADQLIDVSKYLEDTRTVKFDLSRPLFLA